MSTLKIVFKTMASGLRTLAQELERIEELIDRIETQTGTPPRKKTSARPKAKAPARKPGRKPGKDTATVAVLNAIEKSRNGADTAAIKKKTGYAEKKIWNILNRLKKQGKIKNLKRGVYVVK